MNIHDVTRDLERLSIAEALVLDGCVRHALSRALLLVLAALIGLAGVALFEFGAYRLLQVALGSAKAAAVIGTANCTVAALLGLTGIWMRPTREMSLAVQMRRLAVSDLKTDLQSIRPIPADAAVAPVRSVVELLMILVVPLLISLVRKLRKADAGANSTATPRRDRATSLLREHYGRS
jgi:hypothetical protein